MDRFLDSLHSKPDHHKKRFALLASSTVTLFIFGIWSIVNFGTQGGIFAKEESNVATVEASTSEVSPLESVWMNVEASFNSLKQNFSNLGASINYESDMGSDPLDLYDR